MKIDPGIFDELKVFLSEKAGSDMSKLSVVSSYKLSEEEKDQLSSMFKKLAKKDVEIEYRLDKKILGGLIILSGSTIVDLSLQGQLHNLKQELYENT